MNILYALANTLLPGLGFALRFHFLGTLISTLLYGSGLFALQRTLIAFNISGYLPFYIAFWLVFSLFSWYYLRRDAAKRRERSSLIPSLSVFAFGLIVNVLVFLGAPSTFRYQGVNMQPAIEVGATVMIDRLSYVFSQVERNDVVSFRLLIGDQLFISRVVALPGESVEIIGDDILIDGKVISSNLVFLGRSNDQPGQNDNTNAKLTLKEGEYFLVGDNRDSSIDSRRFGSVGKAYIVGRVVF